MGFRTVVVISNDRFDEIQDPVLKDLIQRWWGDRESLRYMTGPYRVVEQVHCDTTTLAVIEHLDAKALAHTMWNHSDPVMDLLKQAADKAGYRLVRKAKK